MKRTFIAADIVPAALLKKSFDHIRNKLRMERIAWANPEQMHITIRFLGDTDEKIIPEMVSKLSADIGKFPAFTLEIQNTGIFKNRDDPRVLWLGCVIPDAIIQLHQRVSETVSDFGFRNDERSYKPHLTLGRIKGTPDRKTLEEVLDAFKNTHFQTQEVNHLIFYESRLTQSGPIYTPIHKFKLGTF